MNDSVHPRAEAAQDLVAWAVRTFGDRLVLACSASVEDSVLVHLAARTRFPVRVFLLDTGRLHPETHDTFDRLRQKYEGLRYEVYSPEASAVEALVRTQGLFGFRESLEARHACCEVRKVGPLKRALEGADAWLTGLRREQSPTRLDLIPVQPDGPHTKVSPLLNWTETDVWTFAKVHHIPTHPLHSQGYPSIGCAPCTRAVSAGEDIRAGRWWWERPEHKECGLHRL